MRTLFNIETLARVGSDIDVRDTKQGKRVANLSVVVEQGYMKDNEFVSKPLWLKVAVWNEGTIKFLEDKVGKGDIVRITSEEIYAEAYETRDGNLASSLVVKIAGPNARITLMQKFKRQEQEAEKPAARSRSRTRQREEAPQHTADLDDEIPF